MISAITSLFSLDRIKLLGVAGLVVACLVLGLLWQNARASRYQAEAERDSYRTANEFNLSAVQHLTRAHGTMSEALAAHREALTEIRTQREADRRAWKEAVKDDQAAATWSVAPLPTAARELLR